MGAAKKRGIWFGSFWTGINGVIVCELDKDERDHLMHFFPDTWNALTASHGSRVRYAWNVNGGWFGALLFGEDRES